MKTRATILLPLLACCAVLTACGPKRINSTDDKTLSSSAGAVRASLPEDQKVKFDTALRALIQDERKHTETGKPLAGINNKTAEEIFKDADALAVRQRSERRKRAEEDIVKLKEQLSKQETIRAELNKVQVTKARFLKEKRRTTGEMAPILEISLLNTGNVNIGNIFFKGSLVKKGEEAKHLVDDDFNFRIPGNLEPGKSKDLRLNANPAQGWGNFEPSPDLVFNVEVMRIEDANGQTNIEGRGFVMDGPELLQKMEKQLAQ